MMLRACMYNPKPAHQPKRVHRIQLKKAVQQAMLICPNFEDTIECRIAWDLVDDLSKAPLLRDNEKKEDEDLCHDELACREYDV